MRPADLAPKLLLDELLRLAKTGNWIEITPDEEDPSTFRSKIIPDTWIKKIARTGADIVSMLGLSMWLRDGPKVFRPSREQCTALEQVEVNLAPNEYQQPFPSILVETDYPPFYSVLCSKPETFPSLAFTLHSKDHLNDVTTTIRLGRYQSAATIEESLAKFDEDCRATAPVAHKALRVAVNSCLALAHFGCHADYLFPKEVESDRRLARESTERGQRAKTRLKLAVQQLSFDQEVRLHRTEKREHAAGEPTGREWTEPKWRKGHWAMQPFGPQVKGEDGKLHWKPENRKRIFRQPVLVRADLFVGDLADTQVTYR